MRKYYLRIIVKSLILLSLLSGFYILTDMQANAQETAIEKSSVNKEDLSNAQVKEQNEIAAAKEKAKEAKTEAEAAKCG
ncbi:MAG: hypothetical protein ABIB11_04110, partial [Candidatus Omnitrophota bacterium]